MPIVSGRQGRRLGVSIRARLIGRAMHSVAATSQASAWVSIRARLIGRAMLGRVAEPHVQRVVSIRARLIGRAMRWGVRVYSIGTWFQSAPG